MKKLLLSFLFIAVCWFPLHAQPNAWINEIHYDNPGSDVDERVEVVIEDADSYDLMDFQISLYNGSNGSVYGSATLDQFTRGTSVNGFTIYYYQFTSGIQNGPDGLALSYQGTVISGQFLSYEGTFTASGGPAQGMTSTDIGVHEPGDDGESLQLSGTGSTYSDFSWNDPAANTFGAVNNNQTLVSPGGDVTPPKWDAGYPMAIGRDVNAVVRIKTDEPGMAYAIAVASGSDAPTSEQVKAGGDYGSVTVVSAANTAIMDDEHEFLINLTGLATQSSYDVWVVAEDNASTPNLQTDPVKIAINTIATRELTMTLPKDKDTVYVNGMLHYEWTSKNIDSLYMGGGMGGKFFIITDDNDRPISVDASLGSYDFKIPSGAEPGIYDIALMDAADTSFKDVADSLTLIDARMLEWVSPEDKDTVYVGDTVKLVWNSEYIDSVFFGGYDYTSQEGFMLEDENGNPLVFPASLGSFDLPIPMDAETDSVKLYIVDASDPEFRDSIDPLYIMDTIAPEIDELTPANGAGDMPYTLTAMIEFNESVTILSGNITLHKEDGTVVKDYDLTGSDIEHNESTILINLGVVLDKGATYYFTMDADAVEDVQHNPFPGISDANTWRFTTAAKQLYFSEYIEGSGNNKALELYNPTEHTIDLSQYAIINTSNGSNWYPPAPMTGTLAPGEVYTIINPDFDFSLLADSAAVVDTLWGAYATYFNGDDARGLVQLIGGSWDDGANFTIIDQIGVEGDDPGSGWDVAGVGAATKDHTLIRKSNVETGNATIGWDASAGTDAATSEWIVMPKNFADNLGYATPNASDNTTITAFELRDTTGNLVSTTVTIDSAAATVTAEVIYSAEHMLDSLVAVITVADEGTTVPTSGDTLDFTNPVTFTVTAADGLTTRKWTVTVKAATTPSTAADILSFSIDGQTGDAVIDAVNHTVTVEMPYGTDVTALTPVFEVSAGAQADPASGTVLDFTKPVTIKVTAEDDATAITWTVTVTVFEPPVVGIYDIQYTTDASGDSPYLGQLVRTSGIVTALNIYQNSFKGYFLQDSAKAWNGIYVYDPAHDTIAVGDSVTIVGQVTEYYNLTEIKNIMELTLNNRGNALPGPVELTTGEASNEMWESVFVTFHNATCLDNDLGHGEVSVDDGSGALIVDDFLYYYDPATDFVIDNVYNLTGVMNFSYGNFKLNPRSADDISDVTGISNTFAGENIKVWPNPSDGNFTVTVEGMTGDVRITILDATGRVVLSREAGNSNFVHEEFNLSNASNGLYFIRIDNGKEMTVKRIVIR